MKSSLFHTKSHCLGSIPSRAGGRGQCGSGQSRLSVVCFPPVPGAVRVRSRCDLGWSCYCPGRNCWLRTAGGDSVEGRGRGGRDISASAPDEHTCSPLGAVLSPDRRRHVSWVGSSLSHSAGGKEVSKLPQAKRPVRSRMRKCDFRACSLGLYYNPG